MWKELKNKKINWEFYSKSPTGMWVKAELVDDGIELSWQVRTKKSGNNVLFFDANGNIESSSSVSSLSQYPSVMKSAGIVPLTDDFVLFSGEENFEDAVISVMRHMVNMVVCGYGEDPSEVVGWYADISKLEFLNGSSFKITEEHDPFIGMNGLTGDVVVNDDGEYIFCVMVDNVMFEIPLEDNKTLLSFIISTTPV